MSRISVKETAMSHKSLSTKPSKITNVAGNMDKVLPANRSMISSRTVSSFSNKIPPKANTRDSVLSFPVSRNMSKLSNDYAIPSARSNASGKSQKMSDSLRSPIEQPHDYGDHNEEEQFNLPKENESSVKGSPRQSSARAPSAISVLSKRSGSKMSVMSNGKDSVNKMDFRDNEFQQPNENDQASIASSRKQSARSASAQSSKRSSKLSVGKESRASIAKSLDAGSGDQKTDQKPYAEAATVQHLPDKTLQLLYFEESVHSQMKIQFEKMFKMLQAFFFEYSYKKYKKPVFSQTNSCKRRYFLPENKQCQTMVLKTYDFKPHNVELSIRTLKKVELKAKYDGVVKNSLQRYPTSFENSFNLPKGLDSRSIRLSFIKNENYLIELILDK